MSEVKQKLAETFATWCAVHGYENIEPAVFEALYAPYFTPEHRDWFTHWFSLWSLTV